MCKTRGGEPPIAGGSGPHDTVGDAKPESRDDDEAVCLVPEMVESSHDDGGKRHLRKTKAYVDSLPYLLTYTPVNKHCDARRIAKMKRKPARRKHRDPDTNPRSLVTLYMAFAQSEEAMGLVGERDAGGSKDDLYRLFPVVVTQILSPSGCIPITLQSLSKLVSSCDIHVTSQHRIGIIAIFIAGGLSAVSWKVPGHSSGGPASRFFFGSSPYGFGAVCAKPRWRMANRRGVLDAKMGTSRAIFVCHSAHW